MPESIYMNPIRPQPFDGGDGTHYLNFLSFSHSNITLE